MSASASNILQDVATYNKANLALLQNSFCFLSLANKKFKDFDRDYPANKGASVTFDTPPRFTTANSLTASFQGVEQNVQTLTVDQEISTSYEFTSEQFILNLEDYISTFGRSVVAEMGTKIEKNIGRLAETNTYRFFGDGVTNITSYLQLANALAFFRNFGAPDVDTRGILSDLTYPAIVNSGLNQFTPTKNEREMMSWEVGNFSRCDWHQSNLLTTHEAGSEGNAGTTLTVVSTTVNADGAVTAITFSGASAPSDPNSVKAYDKFLFSDGVAGQPNIRFLTYIGHEISQNPVQFAATSDAASTAGSQVTVTVNPPLQATAGRNQNISRAITPGMQATVLPTHRCGLIMAGNPLYLAMPRLPNTDPFPSSSITDPDSGASMRMYHGYVFGQNNYGNIHDAIWGSTLVDDYAMMVALPA